MKRHEWAAQFIGWVWPTTFCMVAALFSPTISLIGWTAVAAGFLFMQWFQWAQRQVNTRTRPFLAGVFIVGLMSLGLFWPWSHQPVRNLIAQGVVLIGLGSAIRWLQTLAFYTGRVVSVYYIVFLILGELLYVTGWLVLGWTFRLSTMQPGAVHWYGWFASPMPVVALIMSFQLIGLQSLIHINPLDPEGRDWLRAIRLSVFVGMIAVPLVAIGLLRLPPVWWFLGLLWLYSYKTYEQLRDILKQWAVGEEAPPVPAYITLQYRGLRETLYYGLLLLSLVAYTFRTV